jgi:hypothetical protein
MHIERRGSDKDFGTKEIELDDVKFYWSIVSKMLHMRCRRAGDFNSSNNYAYDTGLRQQEIGPALAAIAKGAVSHPEIFEALLAPYADELQALLAVAKGFKKG